MTDVVEANPAETPVGLRASDIEATVRTVDEELQALEKLDTTRLLTTSDVSIDSYIEPEET